MESLLSFMIVSVIMLSFSSSALFILQQKKRVETRLQLARIMYEEAVLYEQTAVSGNSTLIREGQQYVVQKDAVALLVRGAGEVLEVRMIEP